MDGYKVPNGVVNSAENFNRLSIGCTKVTDDRQTTRSEKSVRKGGQFHF